MSGSFFLFCPRLPFRFAQALQLDGAEVRRMINMLRERGHESPLEHASFTFVVEGVSRACSHQLVRHRLASYSQQSQRPWPMIPRSC